MAKGISTISGIELTCTECGSSVDTYINYRTDGKPNESGEYGRWITSPKDEAEFRRNHAECGPKAPQPEQSGDSNKPATSETCWTCGKPLSPVTFCHLNGKDIPVYPYDCDKCAKL